MSKIVLRKAAAPNPGPYLKDAAGANIQSVYGPSLQAIELLDTTYVLDVDSDYLFDAQPDSPTPALITEVGYPIQTAQIHDPLFDAIMSLNPLSYWPMRETSGTTLMDYGSLGNDATVNPTHVAINTTAGADGYSYPKKTTTSKAGATATDQDGYSRGTNGITIMGLIYGAGVSQSGFMGKGDEYFLARGAFTSSSELYAGSVEVGGLAGRTRYADVGFSDSAWSLFFFTFSDKVGSSYPSNHRVNGVDYAGTTFLTRTGGLDRATAFELFYSSCTQVSGNFTGTLAHVAVFDNQVLSLSDREYIETAATTPIGDFAGWY